MKESFDLIIQVYENLSNMILGLIIFNLFQFILIIVLFKWNKDQENKINDLDLEVKNLSDWFEQTRKVNLKKRSDEKIIIPPRPIKPRRVTQG